MRILRPISLLFALWVLSAPTALLSAPVDGWLAWRGPHQNGTSVETDLIDRWSPGGEHSLWTLELAGGGTPVIAGERLYTLGFRGEGPELREVLVCVNAASGQIIWEHAFRDYLSDIIYNRYAIGSPAVDPETGNVYAMMSSGLLVAFTAEGEKLWELSMMEAYGRLTFPNGRTGSPVVDGEHVIVRGITANWGRQGPGRDRFYAFDKHTGLPIWASTPGIRPRDSSFSTPVFSWHKGRRVFYAGTGCGNVICADARTGDPIWRARLSNGGVNASVIVAGDRLIAIHGKENLDSSKMGRMLALDLQGSAIEGKPGATPVLDAELWRTDLCSFTSSPVTDGAHIYQVVATGELVRVDIATGEQQWRIKLGPDQLHASPLVADGKLYVPMRNGRFVILRPTNTGAEVLSEAQLEGNCLAAPSVYRGRFYVHTTEKLYAFGRPKDTGIPSEATDAAPTGPPVRLQLQPNEILLRAGERVEVHATGVDAQGAPTGTTTVGEWKAWIPPSAKVRSTLSATFVDDATLVAAADARYSAGAFRATSGQLTGTLRGRTVPDLPFEEDFESFALSVEHAREKDVRFAFPPLAWIGARFKWEVRALGGTKILAKTLDRILFQRSMTFIGHPDEHDYVMQADVMTDGDRRTRSTVGVIHQRYIIALKGNQRRLEVSSNYERLRVGVPFSVEPGVWYRLKTAVEIDETGKGTIRAKAWPRNDPEPDQWTLEVPHTDAHRHGAPGLFGFSPQNRYRVYLDNIRVTPAGGKP